MKPFVGQGLATFCTLISFIGILFLLILAVCFAVNLESIMGSTNDPEDGKAVAWMCVQAAGVYALFLAFCGGQVVWHRKRGQVRI
ncbi:hypothetical protein YB2330_000318 [Saitoella coloradoensis]